MIKKIQSPHLFTFIPVFIACFLFVACNSDTTPTTTVPETTEEVAEIPSTPQEIAENTPTTCEDLIYEMIESTELFNLESENAEKQGYKVGFMLEGSPVDPDTDHYTIKFFVNTPDHISTITRFLFHPDSLQLYDDPIALETFDKPIEVAAHFIEKYKAQCLEKSN